MKKLLSIMLVAILLVAVLAIPASAMHWEEGETNSTASDAVTDESVTDRSADGESGEDGSTDVSDKKESTAFEKVFQVIMIVIMSIGVLGLPLYFWLNSRKKRLLSEYNESNGDDGNESEKSDSE
jgi:flagellar basal body-associated protein FliL